MFVPTSIIFKATSAVAIATAPPAAIGHATGLVTAQDMLAQAPVLGILVLVVYLFLKHMKDVEEKRVGHEKTADDKYQAMQEASVDVIKEMQNHMKDDNVLRGRTLGVIEKLERRLDAQDAAR